jgi:hypothetical protein
MVMIVCCDPSVALPANEGAKQAVSRNDTIKKDIFDKVDPPGGIQSVN